jgi:hypothetical protein
VWQESSFIFIDGSPEGWAQTDYWQFKKNENNQIEFIDSTRQIVFGREILDMRIRNKVWDLDDRPGFFYNNDNQANSVRPWLYINQGVSVMVFEPNTGTNWRNQGQQYGSVDGVNRGCFTFNTTEQQGRLDLIQFLDEVVPAEYFVFLFTVQYDELSDYMPDEWALDSLVAEHNLFNILEEQGATLARELEELGAVPYAIMYQKGKSLLDENMAANAEQEINVSCVIPRQYTEGMVRSVLIGPSRNWTALAWQLDTLNNTFFDTTQLNIYGVNNAGVSFLLYENVESIQSLENVSASEYPYLQLEFTTSDEEDKSISFPSHLMVFFQGVPDLALSSAAQSYSFTADTLMEGAELLLTLGLENISPYPIDNVLIRMRGIDAKLEEVFEVNKTISDIEGQEYRSIPFNVSTKGLSQNNELIITVNPARTLLEQHFFNNVAQKGFYIENDKQNPVLNVTFDGQQLVDGDIIGPSPEITIRLKDENVYIPLSDTVLLKMWLTYPNGDKEAIAYNSPILKYTFSPVNESGSSMEIIYRPKFTADGTYQLEVNAEDASGNLSGAWNYIISFEVKTKNSISQLLNYPNPFSTSTRFVYSLTGEPPAYFKIQIMTISGEIVREITQDEIGLLEVGTHTTDFAWDGRDQYGDLLANGVYLYRIVAKDQWGNDYEAYDTYVEDTGLSKYFKRGFGKMVILR